MESGVMRLRVCALRAERTGCGVEGCRLQV